MSDKKLVAFGVFWNAAQLIVNQSFAFLVKLVLAKLLFPEQFGLVGMATVFTGFVQVLNDLGVGAALIQRKEKELHAIHFHTAFWTGLAWSVALFLILSLGVSPLAAVFYDEPLLLKIVPALSLGILFGSVSLVHKAQLFREMRFKKTAFIDSLSSVISGCLALICAFAGAGVWSLVVNSVAAVVIAIPLYFKATGWSPQFKWGKQAFKDVFGFGSYATGSNILNYVYNNIDYLLIGRLVSSSALGVYSLAFVLTDTFRSKIMAVMNRAIYPFYGRNQNDPAVLKKYYLKVVQFNCIVIYPIMIFFCMLGRPFLLDFFGANWEQTILPLQILSVSVMFHMMVSGNTALLRGLGRPGLEMKLQIIKTVIYVPVLAVGVIYYGAAGAAAAVLINKIVGVVIAQYVFSKLLTVKINYNELLSSLKVPVIASLGAFLSVWLTQLLGLHYLIGAAALFLSYCLLIWMLMGGELKILWNQFKPGKQKSV